MYLFIIIIIIIFFFLFIYCVNNMFLTKSNHTQRLRTYIYIDISFVFGFWVANVLHTRLGIFEKILAFSHLPLIQASEMKHFLTDEFD
jgi:hypothetical protein